MNVETSTQTEINGLNFSINESKTYVYFCTSILRYLFYCMFNPVSQ